MNIKRSILFSVLLWIFIFVLLSALMFAPPLKGKTDIIYSIFWILLAPIILLMTKWYFLKDTANAKNGFYLGLIAVAVAAVFDNAITIPLFVKSYTAFYGDWRLYVGLAEVLILCLISGAEYDNWWRPAIDK